ncbi:hypothetical protein [Emticicia sp. BO119]|uniref:hypothetical protein n=1 Tax=Emticicia sp. BO119 TaxID=2757768 RepID=UPI0015F06DD6|nr:hypothetical protein [Emticicia sp. BO119]MBA4848989.1 hypothetical protein [Emticicia sp. BO119]
MSLVAEKNKVSPSLKKFGSLSPANQQEICQKMNEAYNLKLEPHKINLEKLSIGQLSSFEQLVEYYLDNS